MQKSIILLGALTVSSLAYSQVGINNDTPKATLDVTAKSTGNTTAEGIIAPRLSGDDIKGKDTQYTIDQKGAIVYATAAVGSASTKTANITSEGYYYFDGVIWTKFGSGTSTAGAEPWYNSAGNIPATANNQNIYQMGKVGINKSTVPTNQLDVTGDFKANYANGGVNNGINTNYTGLGSPANIMYVANNEDILSATNTSLAFVTPDIASIQSSKAATGGGSISAYSTPNGGNVGFYANSVAANTTSSIWGYNNNGGQNYLELSHNKSNAEATAVKLEKLSGVNFTFRTSANAFEGNYTFPRNNGSANQVLTTDGAVGLEAKLSWKDVSSLVTVPTEPWNVQSTTTAATTNTQNIYQNGNLGLGDFSTTNPLTRLDVRGSVRGGGAAMVSLGVPAAAHVGTVGANSTAFGYTNEASGDLSFAIGGGSKATGLLSFAAGSATQATGSNSTAMGENAIASGYTSFALGSVVTASSTLESVFGINNAIKTGNTTWASTDALFQVGNGNQTSPSVPSNALTILKNGYTAIGVGGTEATAKPTERLDIGSDNGYPVGATGLGGVRIRAINTAAYTGSVATDKVVVADTNGVLKTVAVASVASSLEPWNVQGGTTAATTNAQNIYQTGNVSIGSSTPIAPFTSNSVTVIPKLSVAGDVASTGAFYTTTGKYADYVFEDYYDGVSKIDETYKFKSLEETAAYIKANKHLPGVTSIKDILKTDNGYTVNLSELSIQQLEKIEELYLHTIEQEQEISKQKTEINDLKSRMEKLEQLLVKENNNK